MRLSVWFIIAGLSGGLLGLAAIAAGMPMWIMDILAFAGGYLSTKVVMEAGLIKGMNR